LGLAGLAIAAWFLLDPKNGARRRQQIADTAKDLYDGAGQELGRLSGEFSRIRGDVMHTVSDAVSRVGEMAGIGAGSDTSNGGSASSTSRSARSTRGGNGRS
jgi:hypothetical protein